MSEQEVTDRGGATSGEADESTDPPFGFDDDWQAWRLTRTLRDGTVVTLRPIVPEDAAELRRGWLALSPRSRYLRFMSLGQEPTENMLAYLTNVDQKDHVAIGAIVVSPDLKTERGVGVARFVRLKETDTAEAAITVADDMQRRGLGTLLAHELERAARVRGIKTIRAEVHEENIAMRTSLERSGAIRVPESSGAGMIAYNIMLGDAAIPGEPPSIPRVLRDIVRSVTRVRDAFESISGLGAASDALSPADSDDREGAEPESDRGAGTRLTRRS